MIKGMGFIFLAVAFIAWLFFDSDLARNLFLKVKKGEGVELGMQQSGKVPPDDVPNSSEQIAKQIESTRPTDNVALNKPVIYLPTNLTIDGKEWDKNYFHTLYSINEGNYPSNLTDGNPNTIAYPASWFFDYIIDLGEIYEIEKINLNWGSYGKKGDKIYITSWNLYSQKEFTSDKEISDPDWDIVQSGTNLDEKETVLRFSPPKKVRRFRIYAESYDRVNRTLLNWIGIHEFNAYGKRAVE